MSYVVMTHGRPVAVTEDQTQARVFAFNRADLHVAATPRWTDTGKLYNDRRWTGWEVVETRELKPA